MAGIGFISFNGAAMELNPAGDFLALMAAFLWACYSILTRIISGFGYPTIPATRRIFLYGILFMVPVITIAASVLILHEPFTALTGLGTVLTLAGLFISQNDCFRKRG